MMRGRAPLIDVEPVVEPTPEAARRLRRLCAMAWLLDRSIPIGGGRRIGLDPLLGLIPGLGDWLGAALSSWLVYEAMRLGVPVRVLARMGLNIAIEAAVGVVPLLGDIFDATWQANQRNLRLVERHYDPQRAPRSLRGVILVFAGVVALFLAALGVILLLVARLIWALVAG
jgi:hypothetical protein